MSLKYLQVKWEQILRVTITEGYLTLLILGSHKNGTIDFADNIKYGYHSPMIQFFN